MILQQVLVLSIWIFFKNNIMNKPTISAKIIFTVLFFCFFAIGFAQEIDLRVTKVVDLPTQVEGGFILFEIKAENLSTNTATGILIEDILPPGLTFDSIDQIQQGTFNSTTGVWDLGTLTAGSNKKLKIVVLVNFGTAARTIINTASVLASDQYDPNPNNDSDDAVIVVAGADLEVVKTVDVVSPTPGDTVVYTIVVTNNGPDKANNITIRDRVPSGLTYVSSTISQGNPYLTNS